MAGLTRKFIKDAAKDAGVELPAEMIDAIIGAHVESRDAAIETATKPLNEQLEAEQGKSGTDEFKTKWEQEHEAFEKYKGDVEAKELNGKKQSEIKNLLKELSVSEKRHDIILKSLSPDLANIELDKDGKIKDVDKLKTSITTDWADFIETTEKKPSPTPTPPANKTGDTKEAEVVARVRTAMGLPPETA
ncbi:MAG: hypothetical protein EOM37_11545 [Proteobacteria bacterium]|nr:hypothetical protein [Pseudomonadota bacterium]